MTLSARIDASIKIVQTNTPDGGSVKLQQAIAKAVELINGTGNGACDLAFLDERTLTSGSTEDIDLAGGVADALGNTLTMAEVCAVIIINEHADGTQNTTALTIGGATAEAQLWFAAAGDKEVVAIGGVSLHFSPAGWALTATTADDLKIANASGASNTYQIAVLGRSA